MTSFAITRSVRSFALTPSAVDRYAATRRGSGRRSQQVDVHRIGEIETPCVPGLSQWTRGRVFRVTHRRRLVASEGPFGLQLQKRRGCGGGRYPIDSYNDIWMALCKHRSRPVESLEIDFVLGCFLELLQERVSSYPPALFLAHLKLSRHSLRPAGMSRSPLASGDVSAQLKLAQIGVDPEA